jgi:hypothetical protein
MVTNIESVKPEPIVKESESKNLRIFFKIASISTALGFGCAAASTASLRSSSVGFSFQISPGTFVAFFIGAAIGMVYWKLIARSSMAARVGSLLVGLAGLGLFLYPLRFVPAGNLHDLTIGLLIAAGALTVVGVLLWKIKRYLEADSKRGESPGEPPGR